MEIEQLRGALHANSNANFIADEIELAMHPEHFNKIKSGETYHIKEETGNASLDKGSWVPTSKVDTKNNTAWLSWGKQEIDENRLKGLESNERVRLIDKTLLRTSKKGNKVYSVKVERLIDVEPKPNYKYERKQSSENADIRFRKVEPFKYGEGGTKGIFKGEDGTLYKSLQGGFLDWKDGKVVREYMDKDTQEYEILKMLEGRQKISKSRRKSGDFGRPCI